MPVPADDITGRLSLAVEISRQAGQLTLEYFQDGTLAVEQKDDQSPVTRADREAEILLRQAIQAAFPDDAIHGEELGSRLTTRWNLQPL